MSKRPNPSYPKRQTGIALFMGLIFLAVLTLIGVTAAQMAGLEERMAGNMRDRSLAMQAAELALRDAERDLMNAWAAKSRTINGLTDFTADCGESTSDTDDDGLCYNGPAGFGTPIWTTVSMTGAPSVAYGTHTGANIADASVAILSALPRYIIEGMRKTPPGGSEEFWYRITVRAQGANPNTVVWLQEVFKP